MTERDRTIALYTFLKEFVQLRTKTIRDLSRYEQDGQVIWAAEIPRERGCHCIAWHRDTPDEAGDDAPNEVWIEIRKPRLTRPPEPPESVHPWVRRERLDDSSLERPELFPALPGESDEDPPLELDDHPEVRDAWDAYIEGRWRLWAEQDRRERAIQSVYTDLFSVFQRQQRLGESFEVVFGLGFLIWTAPDGQMVRRHLVTAHVTVSFDTERGTLTVTPAGEGARPTLEQDMLDPQYRPDSGELRSIEETLEQLGESLWAAGPLDGVLKSWVHSASSEGEYTDALERPERAASAPRVHLAPALILRRRTERSFIRAFQEIIDQLNSDHPVPEGCRTFVSVSEDAERGNASGENGHSASPGEIYFPLPANEAQREIVRRLTANQGVLVQGPPGTGKSHTIVNLICHALATGQRVLVTSHAVRALKVLQRMILDSAPDLAPLSVVLLGDDRNALLAMEESVQGITTRQNTWTAAGSQTAISQLEGDLDRQRRREARVLADLRAIRERETEHDAGFGYSGTLARISAELHQERESLSWVQDETPEGVEPPLSTVEFDELVSLGRNERISQWEAGGRLSVELDGLPTSDAFEQAVHVEREARATYESETLIRERPEYKPLEAMNEDDRGELAGGLRKLVALIDRIERRPLPWTEEATKQILGDFERTWRQLHEDTSTGATWIAESAQWLDANPIGPEPPPDLPKLRADARDLLDHLKAGGGWGFGPVRAKVVKRALYIRELRIGGRQCKTVSAVSDLLKWVDAELEVRSLRERWAPHHAIMATTFTARATELQDLCEPIRDAFAALETKEELSAILRRTPGTPEPEWSDRASLLRLGETLAAILTTLQYEAARAKIIQPLQDLLVQRRRARGDLDPISEHVQVAVEERNASAYTTARQHAADNAELSQLLHRKRELLNRLTVRAPRLAREMIETCTDAVWDERAGDFERAWNWSRAHAWVIRLAEPGAEHRLRLELDHTKKRIARTLERIAAERAWVHCFSRMTENERQHLVAWSKAVQAIGKGTGKYAPLHRRNARDHLNESRSAIPAWVMPLHRVAETIKPGSEVFDIAIIDEASQSGPEALLLAWLSTKLVIVGDDKQIRPTYAGVDFEDVNRLRERYISELPHADIYGVDHSLFDLAEIRYGSRIRLREHFRRMPEIIQFSNNLSYANEPLIPLRRYGAGRLEPTVTARHVPDGYQNGAGARSVNPPEAEALVDEIVRISREPAYADKTIGVISLVGDAQARDVETRLIRRLGPEETERRQLVCGDAYAFQGDERDVMFLSMVSAPRDGRSIRAMTDADTQRRFNVAASRAKDQLYLFHTATLADLNPTCMRYQLLQYCLAPQVAVPDVAGLDLSELERLAVQVHREPGNQPEPFESWFELDVFLRVARRGYRVIPQFEIAGCRIDLVVQGMDGSLAVECDGDAWHGVDRYEQDAARQRDLERCGWTFWRVRESVFRLDPDEALSDLWETLKAHGVLPTAADEPQGEDTAQVSKDLLLDGPPVGRERSTSVPRGARGESDPARGPDQRRGESSAPQPIGPLPGPDGGSGIAAGPKAIGRPPHTERITTEQSVLQLSNPNRIWADAGEVGGLEPYVEWSSSDSVPDPRIASQTQLANLLEQIVRREGPVVAIRAYRLINRASGRQRLTAPARHALNRACAAAVRAGNVVATNPLDLEGQAQLVLRSPKSPGVIVRERGPRELDELPPDEVAMMMRVLRGANGTTEIEALKRQVLDRLGWVRLTRNVNEFLDQCIALM